MLESNRFGPTGIVRAHLASLPQSETTNEATIASRVRLSRGQVKGAIARLRVGSEYDRRLLESVK